MEEDFYGTIKFKNGEEIFAKVAASEEEDRTMLILHNPILITEIKGKRGIMGYKVEPWLLEKICLLLIWLMFLHFLNLLMLR